MLRLARVRVNKHFLLAITSLRYLTTTLGGPRLAYGIVPNISDAPVS